jgi:hypothetical protein
MFPFFKQRLSRARMVWRGRTVLCRHDDHDDCHDDDANASISNVGSGKQLTRRVKRG